MIKILPLGGCGEIGMNSTVIEIDDEIFIVDAGIGFPSCNHYGIDLLIPDFSYIKENRDRVRAIFLTHGHDDHIGALPYLFSTLSNTVPVYGGRFTLALAAKRFEEATQNYQPEWKEIEPLKPITVGPVEVEFIPVTHSIADSYSVAINSEEGTIIHTGDFKIDSQPLYGERFEFRRFIEYGERGVKILLSDSTNSEQPGISMTEREVKESLKDIFLKATGRVIFTTFSSHISRLREVLDISREVGRKVFISGRSIRETVEIALNMNLLDDAVKEIFTDSIDDIPDEKLTIIVTGSQGEAFSTLYRISKGVDKTIKIKENDIVIVSAKFIPGQEKAIYSYINRLYELGVKEVFYEKLHNVHASGHGYREELRTMIKMVQPEIFIPIHGEYRQLELHRRIAAEEGIQKNFILVNGNGLMVDGDRIQFFDYPVGITYVDGENYGNLQGELMKKRRFMAREGLMVVFGVITDEKHFALGPRLFSIGIIEESKLHDLIPSIHTIAEQTLSKIRKLSDNNIPQVEEEIRIAIRRFLRDKTGKNPIVTVLLDFEKQLSQV